MMKEEKSNIKDIRRRIEAYCSTQERCLLEVTLKLRQWGLSQKLIDSILSSLKTDKFIDEERFSILFCRGKLLIKKWGRRKIISELKKKQISINYINTGIKEIDTDVYLDILRKQLYKKWKEIKEKNHLKRKKKIVNYLLQKGFESALIWQEIEKLTDK